MSYDEIPVIDIVWVDEVEHITLVMFTVRAVRW